MAEIICGVVQPDYSQCCDTLMPPSVPAPIIVGPPGTQGPPGPPGPAGPPATSEGMECIACGCDVPEGNVAGLIGKVYGHQCSAENHHPIWIKRSAPPLSVVVNGDFADGVLSGTVFIVGLTGWKIDSAPAAQTLTLTAGELHFVWPASTPSFGQRRAYQYHDGMSAIGATLTMRCEVKVVLNSIRIGCDIGDFNSPPAWAGDGLWHTVTITGVNTWYDMGVSISRPPLVGGTPPFYFDGVYEAAEAYVRNVVYIAGLPADLPTTVAAGELVPVDGGKRGWRDLNGFRGAGLNWIQIGNEQVVPSGNNNTEGIIVIGDQAELHLDDPDAGTNGIILIGYRAKFNYGDDGGYGGLLMGVEADSHTYANCVVGNGAFDQVATHPGDNGMDADPNNGNALFGQDVINLIGNCNVLMGLDAYNQYGTGVTAIGSHRFNNGNLSVGIGTNGSNNGGERSTAIGCDTIVNSGDHGAILIGYGAKSRGPGSIVIGNPQPGYRTTSLSFGFGGAFEGGFTPNSFDGYDFSLQGVRGIGTNKLGGALILAGGLATGNVASGKVAVQFASVGATGTALQTATTRMQVGETIDLLQAVTLKKRSITASRTLDTTDLVVFGDATAGVFNLTLPSAATFAGTVFFLKKIDASANAITVIGTVDGVVNPTLTTAAKNMVVASDGTAWYKLA